MAAPTNGFKNPLNCPECGSPVPLGEGRTQICTACDSSVAIPPEYAAWREQQAAKLAAESRLVELHQELGYRPRAAEVWLTRLRGKPGCCLFTYLSMVLGRYFIELMSVGLRKVAPFLPKWDLPAWLGGPLLAIFVVFPYFAGAAAVMWSLARMNRRVRTLETLQGSLIVGPPLFAGGPAACRSCGGAVEILPEQICSPCFYCGSQNLVVLDPAWAKHLRQGVEQRQLSLQEALERYEIETQKAQARLGRYIRNALILALLFSFLFAQALTESPESHQYRDRAIKSNTLVSPQEGYPSLPINTPIRFVLADSENRLEGYYQAGYLEFWIPMEPDDVLEVVAIEAPPLVLQHEWETDIQRARKRNDSRSGSWPQSTLEQTKSVKLTAEGKAWCKVRLNLEKVPRPQTLTLEFRLPRPAPAYQNLPLKSLAVGGFAPGQTLTPKQRSEAKKEDGQNWVWADHARAAFDSQGRVTAIVGEQLSHDQKAISWNPETFGPGEVTVRAHADAGYLANWPSGALLVEHTYRQEGLRLTVLSSLWERLDRLELVADPYSTSR
jgi:hypothetical protein